MKISENCDTFKMPNVPKRSARRTSRQKREPAKYESDPLLAKTRARLILFAYVRFDILRQREIDGDVGLLQDECPAGRIRIHVEDEDRVRRQVGHELIAEAREFLKRNE